MAQKQIPDIETTLDRDDVKSSEDYRLVRDTSTGSDVKTPAGSAGGYDVGSGADEIPTNSDVDSAVAAHSNKEGDVHGAPDGEKLLNTAVSDYRAMPIGIPFGVWDHLAGIDPPSNDGTAKFIRLTAGEDGSGEYNEGLLQNESVSGSAPEVEATAEIAVGDLSGETVHLINTEEAFLRAREISGELQFDQMQQIIGSFGDVWLRGQDYDRGSMYSEGAFNDLVGRNYDLDRPSAYEYYGAREIDFNSSNSDNARTSSSTDGETRAKNISATYYMRIV